MTEITEKVVEQVEKVKVVKIICDWCGQTIPTNDPMQRDRETPVKFTAEYVGDYDGGGRRKGWKVPDLCQSCGAKLHDLLAANGVKIVDIDEDW